ncbi:EamA family transporter, partial [Bacillus cereus]
SFENPLFYCCILMINILLKKEGILHGIYFKSTKRKTYFHPSTFT